MHRFARILFHMNARDANRVIGADRNCAALGQRLVELGYLIALWQIGIEIILSGENRPLVHRAPDRERCPYGQLDGSLV